MNKKTVILLLLVMFTLLFTGCIPGDGRATAENPARFLWGIWHGWVAPVSLIISLFNPAINIYESWNTGFWYDLGFYMAILGGFGSVSLSRKKKKYDRGDRD